MLREEHGVIEVLSLGVAVGLQPQELPGERLGRRREPE
jgi:hypothetical protein